MNALRLEVIRVARGRCEWPSCSDRGTELAHLTSKGMGGSKFRDRLDNVMWACWSHARVSDGLPPAGGGVVQLRLEYAKVPGAMERGTRHRDVIEALREYLRTRRPIDSDRSLH